MTTYEDLIERTRNHLMTGTTDHINVLQTTVSDSATLIQFEHELKGVAPNGRIHIGLEEMYVVSVAGTAAGSSVTVIRGFGGSTAAAHTDGDVIYVNPQFSPWSIAQAVNDELNDLSSPQAGLFRIRSVSFDYNPAQSGYDIDADDLIDIWRVRYDVPGPSKVWPVLRSDEWYLDQDADTDPDHFPGGKQLVLQVAAFPGRRVRVSYKGSFAPLTSLSDDVLAVSGLHAEAHDIPPLGAAIRLSVGRETKRSLLTQQPEPRRSQEVGPGSATNAIRPLMQVYMDRIESEVTRLQQRFPEQV